MADLEKVIKGFECCHVMVHDLGPDKSSCGICPYKDVQTEEQIDLGGIECVAVLHDDALELLKEQQETIASLQGTIYKLNAALAEQPEQKHGHWIVHLYKYGHNRCECGECKHTTDVPYPCCPWCNAKMDGEMKQDE